MTAPGQAPAARADGCDRLPTSARRPRACNPQEECLRLLAQRPDRGVRATVKTDCARLPTGGTCYGPEIYNPREECHARQRR